MMNLEPGKLYEVVPAERNPLLKTFGSGAVIVEMTCFELMSRQLGEHYKGGQWEFRRYLNGALMMVFLDETAVKAISGNQREVVCTIEAISVVAWMMALSQLNMVAHEREDHALSQLCHDHYHACREAVCGQMRFVIDSAVEDGYRQLNDAETAVIDAIDQAQRVHPHAAAIMELLD